MRSIFIRAAAGLALFVALRAAAAIDLTDFDFSTKPADDFFQFVNGGWLRRTPIPPGRSRWGPYDAMEVRNWERMRAICTDAAAKGPHGTAAEQMVGDFYASGLDQAGRNAAGFTPLLPEFERIRLIGDPAGVLREIAQLQAIGVEAGFVFTSAPDAADSGRELAQLQQAGLGLPNRDYYLRDDPASARLRTAYAALIERLLQLLGDSPDAATTEAAAILRIETALAKASLSNEAMRSPRSVYHRLGVAELEAQIGDADWPTYFQAIGAHGLTAVNLAQPEFFAGFARELNTASVDDWKAYLRWHLINSAAPYLSEPFEQASFAFYGQTLSGARQMRPDWERVVTRINGSVSDALGQLFVARYFSPKSKQKVLQIAANVRAVLRDQLEHLAWMDSPTRAKAVIKLDALKVAMGFPDHWRDYRGLRLDRRSYVLNVMRSNTFALQRAIERIGQPTPDEWRPNSTMPEIRGGNDLSRNQIEFTAGFLQPPVFDLDADPALNYGAIGAVIGHELTHAFDDQGRNFDAHGNLVDWWTPASARQFTARAQAIVAQFSAYTVLDGVHLIGARTQGENIADLGGVKLAYLALERELAGRPRNALDGFTPEQRFFISWAVIRRGELLPAEMRLRVETDPHSPPQFRCNGPLSNLDEFAEAFQVPAGAPMRRPPNERVQIW